MDKIKRFIDCYIPITTCTLRCKYCYITQHRLFNGPIPHFKYSPEHVRQALSIKRLGGPCFVNMCAGGETLLSEDTIKYAIALIEEGHYVGIVTNATISKRFDQIASLPTQITSHLFFKFSYHYMELKERNLLDDFFNNIRKVRNAGCSFTLELTPSDDAIPFINDIIDRANKELGATNHVTIARDERYPDKLPIFTHLTKDEYNNTWGKFDSDFFKYKMSIFEKKRKEFCYAGDWSFYLNLATGDMTQCYKSYISQNIFEDINKPINFIAIGHNCSEHHCYNGHAFLTFGDIPGLSSPTYAEIRNRNCEDGTSWLTPDMASFMSSKLNESNKEYGNIRKFLTDLHIFRIKAIRRLKSVLKK